MAMILNPDMETRKRILIEVRDNDGYCPCMIERNEDTKCKCKWAREEDTCVCGLYVVKED